MSARHDSYDVVVIGGGIGGLTAGALLAHAGKQVLVVDENERPGGLASSFRRGAYTFDPADHLITACEQESPFGPGSLTRCCAISAFGTDVSSFASTTPCIWPASPI